ncbi:MAG TPA: ThuA domain-containing protein [Planctomycetota bacterium]|nr:ThuA domain-containing protein [Planctomycetota bacterium]
MRRFLPVLAVLMAASAFAHAQDKIKVLIVDGQNNHNYKAMTPFMKEQLEKSGLFTVDVSTTPPAAPAAPKPGKEETPEQKEAREKKTAELKEQWGTWRPSFKEYKVVLSNYNGERWPADVGTAFEEYVRGGGGFLVIHAANNAFSGWKEYDQMIGLGWRGKDYGARLFYDDAGALQRQEAKDGPGAGHGAQHEFVVTIRDADHPITKGMPKTWLHAIDELYQGQRGPAEKMQILASAFADRSKGGTGANEPMLWVIPYGQGKVVTNVMGHENGKAVQCVGFVTLMLRSCEWLATGKVTVPIPENFPTAEKSSLVGGK